MTFMTKKKKLRIAKRLAWILAAIDQSDDIPTDIMNKIIEFIYDVACDVGGVPLMGSVRTNLLKIMDRVKKKGGF